MAYRNTNHAYQNSAENRDEFDSRIRSGQKKSTEDEATPYTKRKKLSSALDGEKTALDEKKSAYIKAVEERKQEEKRMKMYQSFIEEDTAAYQATADSGILKRLEKTKTRLGDVQKTYTTALERYRKAVAEYDTEVRRYNSLFAEFQDADKKWKAGLRTDLTDINRDLENAGKEREYKGRQLYDSAGLVRAYERSMPKGQQFEQWANVSGARNNIERLDMEDARDIGALQYLLKENQERDIKRLDRRIEELEAEKYYAQTGIYMDREDFKEKAVYKSTANGNGAQIESETKLIPFGGGSTEWESVSETGFGDILYDYINKNEDAVKLQNEYGVSEIWDFIKQNPHIENMTDDERGVFNYLYHNNRDEALSYVSGLKDDLKNRAVAKREKETREYAKEHPIAASAGTVASAPINALAGLLNAGNYIVTGEINEDAGYNELIRHDKIVREAVSENWGAVGSFAYNVGMGLLDFVVTRKIGKIGGKIANIAKGGALTTEALNKINSATTLTLMSSRSMADTAVNAKLQGLNDDQAFSLGVISAAAEALTEKFSLDALLDDSVKGWRYIAQNALTEASEETASSAINFMADIAVSKEKSEWIKAIEQYEKSGYSAKEAYGKAFGDQLLSIGLDALGGAISGGVLAGSISLINSASSKIAERRTKENTENAEVFDSVRENIAKQAEERTEQKMATMTKAQPIGAETPVSGQAMGEGAPAPEVQATAQKGVPLRTAEQVMRGEKVMGQTAADMFRQGSAEQAKNTTGNAEYTPEEMARMPQAEKAETETERTGIIYGVAEDNIQAAKRIASTISREVVFYKRRQTADGIMAEDPPEIGGYYNSGDGKIYINANAKDPIARIIAHEMTHSVELADSYNVLFGSILKQIKRSGGKLDSMVADTIARYKAHGETLDDNGAKREIVAEYVAEKLLTDERSIMELAQADQKSANLIMRFVDSLLSKFGTAKTKERAFLRRTRKLYAEVLLETTSERNRQAWRDNMRKQLAQLDSDFEAGKITEEAYEKHRDTLEKEISMAGEEYSAEVPQYSISDKEKLAERKEAWYNNANKTIGGANDGREVDNRGRRMGFQETDNGGQTTNSNGYIRKAQGNGKQTGVGIYSGRDTEIHTSDSEGRQIEATLAEKLKDTAVLDADGKPLAVYHFTPEGEFTEFKKGDIGFHFGSKAQAEKRGRDIKAQKGRTFRTYLNIKKPIRARLDIMGWRARPASMYLWTEGYLTDEEHETIKKLSARDDGYYSEAAIQLRKILEEKGYDGIVYPNGFEGDGDSYIAFHDEQIIKTDIDDVTLQSHADSGEPKKQFSIAKNTDGEEALRQEYDARVAEDAYLSDLAAKRDTGEISSAEFEKRYNDYVSTNPELIELEAKIMRAARDKVRFKKESAQAAGDNTDTQKQDVRKAEKEIFSVPQEVTEKISGQVDLWMRGDMRPDEHFEFGKTPEVLKQLGAQNLPIVMGQSVMVKITGGSHAIALDVIKDIPNAMADPVMVFKSDTVKNAFVILTEHNDKSGDAVVVALHLNKEEKHIRVNRVASIYGKEKVENFIQNQTATGNLKYIDKNKSQAWSQSRGLQLPKLADTNPDNNIILYKENVVNRYIIKKSRKYAQDSENDKKRREGQGKLQFSIGGTATLEKPDSETANTAEQNDTNQPTADTEVQTTEQTITKEEVQSKITELRKTVEGKLRTAFDMPREIWESTIKEMTEQIVNLYTSSEEPDFRKRTKLYEEAYKKMTNEATAYAEKTWKLRDMARKTAVTITPKEADALFKRNDRLAQTARELLHFSDFGGISINELYTRLSKVDEEVFNKNITETGKQLSRIVEVIRNASRARYAAEVVTEYGSEARKAGTRNEFNKIFSAIHSEAMKIRGYVKDGERNAESNMVSERPTADAETEKSSKEEAKSAYRNITAARRRMDTVRNKTKLSDTDQAVVGQLLRGEVTPNEIPEESNAEGIMAVYEAKREYESYVRRMQEADMPEAVQKAYDEIPKVRRKLEKAQRKHKLSTDDTMHVGRLLRGEIRPAYLPENSNVEGIMAVYEAKWEYEMYAKEIRDWKHGNAEAMRAEIHEDLSGLHAWRDKKWGLGYSTETMERNFRFVMGDDADGMIAKYITPVHKAAAASNTLKNEMRDRVRALNLSRKVEKGNLVSESHAVQLKGEAEDNIRILEQMRDTTIKRDGKTLQEWKGVLGRLTAENRKMDWKKVDKAIKEFHDIYDTLFRMMNEARVRNGYEPVNYRSGYFPHFQPGEEGVLQHFAKALGIDVSVDALPTSINGMTHMFKPGIQWFGNAQQRLKFNTVYDAVEGFDKYIEGVADVIYQTDNIKRLRALANEIRYLSTEKGIQEQVDEIRGRDNLQDKEKEELIQSILEKGKTKLSNFAVELDEYTNLLANKKSHADRAMEQKFGRAAYDVMRKVNSNVAGSMVSLNITSWITNFIPLTQAWGLVDTKYMAKGMWGAFRHHKTPDDIVARSTFLTNRRGSDVLVEMWQRGAQDKNVLQKFGQGWNATIHKLSNGMEHIDTFVSDSIVRARYKQNLDAGMSELAAMDDADAFAASVIADRSKGAMPTIFYQTNPITKMFTQFQLEVKNQFGYFFKDVPQEAREKGILVLAAAFTKILFSAWLFNEIFEKLFGRRPALDPIDMAISLFGDTFGFEMPNIFDMAGDAIRGEEISFKTEDEGNLGTATSNLAAGIGEELPFVSGVLPLVLGETFEGGRYPVASALPNLSKIWTEVTDKDKPLNRKGVTVAKELGKPLVYGILPGGGQVKKVVEGIAAAVQGGSYTIDTDGNQTLQYPVYNHTLPTAIWNGGRAALFGKSTLRTAQEWVKNDFDGLEAKDTAIYEEITEMGVRGEEVMPVIQALRKIRGNKELKGAEKSNAKRDAIRISGLPEEAKKALYRREISDTKDDDIKAIEDAGLSFDSYLQIQNQYASIDDTNLKAGEKAVAFARYLNSQMYTKEQKEAAKSVFQYWSGALAKAENYDEFYNVGLTDEKAANLTTEIGKLTPEEGKETVSNLQRYRTVATAALTDKEKMAALSTMMGESEYAKLEIGNKHGIAPGTYVLYLETLPKFNTDGNTSYKQEEVEAALNAMGHGGYTLPKADGINRNLTNTQKAVLWQLANKSWKPKNNPYNVSVGTQVYNALKSKD